MFLQIQSKENKQKLAGIFNLKIPKMSIYRNVMVALNDTEASEIKLYRNQSSKLIHNQ
jgi:hypothetical protein